MYLQLSMLSGNWIPSAGVNGPKSCPYPTIPNSSHAAPYPTCVVACVVLVRFMWGDLRGLLFSPRVLPSFSSPSNSAPSCVQKDSRIRTRSHTTRPYVGGPPSFNTSTSHLGSGSHCCSARHFWLRWCLFFLYLIQLLLHPSGLCIVVRLVPSAVKKCTSLLQMETTILLQHLHSLTYRYTHSNGRNPCRLKAWLLAQVRCICCSVCALSTQQSRCWRCGASVELVHDSTGAEGAERASATPPSFRFERDERIKRCGSKGVT